MEKYRLHTGWTFCLDERNEKEETAPSEGFRAVTLPHDWSTDYPFDPESDTCGSGGYAKAGIGWYQRTITISENDIKSRQIILYFEGVYMKSSVFVNGTYAGGHIYGYTPFEVDITALVHEEKMRFLFVWTTPCARFTMVFWFRYYKRCVVRKASSDPHCSLRYVFDNR